MPGRWRSPSRRITNGGTSLSRPIIRLRNAQWDEASSSHRTKSCHQSWPRLRCELVRFAAFPTQHIGEPPMPHVSPCCEQILLHSRMTLSARFSIWCLELPWSLELGAWSFRSPWRATICSRHASIRLLKHVDVADAHYLTDHPDSAADRIAAGLGLCSDWLGLLSGRRIAGADCSNPASLARVAGSLEPQLNCECSNVRGQSADVFATRIFKGRVFFFCRGSGSLPFSNPGS
jgi:hypothetical protein